MQVLNILNMLYTLRFFSSKCSLFHNANLFGSCIIHILYTEGAKLKKKKFRRQRVKGALKNAVHTLHCLLDLLDSTFNISQSPGIPTSHSALSIFAVFAALLVYFDVSTASTEFVELFLRVSWNSVARGSEAVSVTRGSSRDVKQSITFLSTASQTKNQQFDGLRVKGGKCDFSQRRGVTFCLER